MSRHAWQSAIGLIAPLAAGFTGLGLGIGPCHAAEADATATLSPAAETAALTGGVEVDVPSRYVARGVPVNDGPAFQPAAWLGYADLTATAWASFDPAGPRSVADRPTDLTVALAWSAVFGRFSVEPSVTWITYPGVPEAATTAEAAVETSVAVGPVSACATNIVDAAAFRGAWYGWAGLCFEHPFTDRLVLEANAGAGAGNRTFNEANFGVRSSGLDHAEANLALTLPLADAAYLRAHGTVSRLVHPALRRALPEPTVAFAGAAVGFEI